MCRSTDYYNFRCADQNLLKIKAFFVRLSGFDSCKGPLSNSLTLLFPIRINESALEVSGATMRSDSSALLVLHRMVNVRSRNGEAIYGSRERVRVGDGVGFEVYSGEEKVLKGIFRREEEKWKMKCKCALETRDAKTVGGEGAVADVCVEVDGDVAMGERVEMVARKNRRVGFDRLEDIPEESEFDGVCCCECAEAYGGGMEGDCGGAEEMYGCGGGSELGL
ncbi:Serine/threonine-protein kinase fray2 isoform 1 [Hibiscus syriacus]|uniref:Serine/threonine-protein kinase fray2 isoform 1 n=1 Tax=Hibiscus syriacus TaxID=106335 RepID=A0A6A3CT61_HIBSY|nr:uncharacterized protein LOC120133537 [Hibiscus syriacus]KAE8732735.1 Serine/threonine-protein kinase fray2 isoform 1 [Hibiscus syriacus]